MKKKMIRIIVKLECTSCRSNNTKLTYGVSRYITKKNKKNTPERLILNKYCPFCNKSTFHKEIK